MQTPIIEKQISLVDGFIKLRRYDLIDVDEAYIVNLEQYIAL